jgi:hypothetical protein
MPKAHKCNIQTFSLDTHACQAFPHCLTAIQGTNYSYSIKFIGSDTLLAALCEYETWSLSLREEQKLGMFVTLSWIQIFSSTRESNRGRGGICATYGTDNKTHKPSDKKKNIKGNNHL